MVWIEEMLQSPTHTMDLLVPLGMIRDKPEEKQNGNIVQSIDLIGAGIRVVSTCWVQIVLARIVCL